MGFKKLINSKKILSLFAAFMLLGTNVLMAQTETSGSATATRCRSSKSRICGWE